MYKLSVLMRVTRNALMPSETKRYGTFGFDLGKRHIKTA